MNYLFEKAKIEDLETIYTLINERMMWMLARGIDQWEPNHYWNIYPKSYYYDMMTQGKLYVLRGQEVLGAIILYEEDNRWENGKDIPAYYLHNFVTTLKVKGIGKIILKEVEQLAIKNSKEVIRLDCMAKNDFLNGYYENLGYLLVGNCVEGIYYGNLREKILKNSSV